MIILRNLSLLLLLLQIGNVEAGGTAARSTPELPACTDVETRVHAEHGARTQTVTVEIEIKNARAAAVYMLDDTAWASPFQVDGETLRYDLSSDFYLTMAQRVLSTAHAPKRINYQVIAPDHAFRRQETWSSPKGLDKKHKLNRLVFRATLSSELPASAGETFVRDFGKAPHACAIESEVAIGTAPVDG